ncbi:MAG TPA: NAD(+) synthase [Bacilli bacterium]|nr:NAD(+) synthase [Bacilli bacterium]
MYSKDFIKVAAASPKIVLGKPLENVKEMLKILKKLDQDVDVIVFPELAITGYSCGDLFYSDQLYLETQEAIKYLLNNNPFKGVVLFGSYVFQNSVIYNCSFVVQDNELIGVVPKEYLPHSEEFEETRWFGKKLDGISYLEFFKDTDEKDDNFYNPVPFGKMLFKFYNSDITFGCEVCGDMWAPQSVSEELYLKGADIVFNCSSSPARIYKTKKRELIINNLTYKYSGAYVYASTGASETSSNVIFGSELIISETGKTLVIDDKLSFDSKIIVSEIDIAALRYKRRKSSYYKQAYMKANNELSSDLSLHEDLVKNADKCKLTREFDKNPFVPKDDLYLDQIISIQTAAVYKRFMHVGAKKLVLGVSGGRDSTLALLSLVKMCDTYNLSRNTIIGVTMPTSNTKEASYNLALTLMKKLGVEVLDLNIEKEVNRQRDLINHQKLDTTYENIQARYRTFTLMNIANKVGGIVIGTSNLSEIALGFTTFNGDNSSMYAINSGIPKTVVRKLLEHYIGILKEVKEEIKGVLKAPISPELLPGKQNTEEILGSYEINDFILYHKLVNGATDEKLISLLGYVHKLSKEEAEEYVTNFNRRLISSQYKRYNMAEGVKVFDVSLSLEYFKLPGDMNK